MLEPTKVIRPGVYRSWSACVDMAFAVRIYPEGTFHVAQQVLNNVCKLGENNQKAMLSVHVFVKEGGFYFINASGVVIWQKPVNWLAINNGNNSLVLKK